MIYSGAGPLALIVFVLMLVLYTALLSGYRPGDASSDHPLLTLAVFLVSGVIVWFLGRFLNRTPIAVEELTESGRKTMYYPKHSLFFVRMEYWGPIFFVIFSVLMLWQG
jgi:hypothetical protein